LLYYCDENAFGDFCLKRNEDETNANNPNFLLNDALFQSCVLCYGEPFAHDIFSLDYLSGNARDNRFDKIQRANFLRVSLLARWLLRRSSMHIRHHFLVTKELLK